ncbi:MAG: GTPase ObgE [Aquificaceae bacterium]
MFVDWAKVYVRAGDGGDGAVAFLREKYKPFGGPAGGDGGRGGDVLFVASTRKHTLYDFKHHIHFRAQRGENGKGKNKHGKDGKDLVIEVPLGTTVKDAYTGKVLCDLVKEGDVCFVARGGRGGRGNSHFATPTDQAPKYAEKGEKGEERWLLLELKLIADVGLIGLPNAGKSTLLSKLTKARPKIADYPFTTLKPILGVFSYDKERRIVLVDIPGLVEGASEGRGLGHEFLRHIERTKLLLHLIDVSDSRQMDPLEAFRIINLELEKHNPELSKKAQVVVGTKVDMLSNMEYTKRLEDMFKGMGYDFVVVSAITGYGMEKLKKLLLKKFEEVEKHEQI